MTRAGAMADTQLLLFEPYPVRERFSRRARRVRVDVQPDGEVVLTIPLRASLTAARAFLRRQHAWIEKTRARLLMARHAAPPLRWPGAARAVVRAAAEREARRVLDEESARLGLAYTKLTLRDARTRWGSCGADGSIMLSLRLVLAPPAVLRYVVIHELCHLRWRGHGPRFWALVEKQMPDYAVHRAWLRRHGEALHAATLVAPAEAGVQRL